MFRNGARISTLLSNYNILLAILCVSNAFTEQGPEPFAPGVTSRHGVFIEKWDGVDTYDIETLLKDPRYPNLPTWSGYSSSFTQPENWGENFGTRIRTYFVPQQSGSHIFYLSSNNEGKLFLSKDESPLHKSMIACILEERFVDPMVFNKYTEQTAWPIQLAQGKVYYMEALMKEYYGDDHFMIAVKTPDGKFYAPIPSQFLWTGLPPLSVKSATAQIELMKVAARAGARAGANAGESAASRSGARAGAAAGAAAGAEGGAKAGAEAAAKAARRVMNKAINLALKAYSGPGQVINIHLNKYGFTAGSYRGRESAALLNGIISSGSAGPIGGSSAAVSGSSGIAIGGFPPGTAVEANGGNTASSNKGVASSNKGTSLINTGRASSNTGGISSNLGVASTNKEGASSTETSPSMSRLKPASPPVFTALLPDGTTMEQKIHLGGHRQHLSITQEQAFVYFPKPGEDPDEIARKITYDGLGMARQVVIGARYTIHSLDTPAKQLNETLNMCLRSQESHIILKSDCHFFTIRRGLEPFAGRDVLSFESACIPGYYIVQRNYKFVLEKRQDTTKFDRDSSFVLHKITTHATTVQIMMIHHDMWFMCESSPWKRQSHYRGVELLYTSARHEFLDSCSFNIAPIPRGKDPKINCKNVLHVARPTIEIDRHPALVNETCVTVEFINKELITFKLITDVNNKEYLVSEGVFKLRVIVKRPELHPQVSFKAEDLKGERRILLNGDKTIAVVPKQQCDDFLSVEVSSSKG
ncbi:predicted protein [Nematostella vectensis]|uniref:PA14 domain-containing protein n=1 Tax=Nematostella vectensis TaxID=45351 RepID=A7SW08_NEMVE|nr:predicted protein [Nematostella vectensis]|eukprot:XP_001624208.1 predicted protein [Nematostella vectensis]